MSFDEHMNNWLENVKLLQKCALVNDDGKILSLKRSNYEKDVRSGCWDLCGGRVEKSDVNIHTDSGEYGNDAVNDIVVNALLREIQEESGLVLKPSDIRVVHVQSGYDKKNNVLIVALGYSGIIEGESSVILSHEHDEYAWLSKEEFMNLDVGDDGGLLKSIVRKAFEG